MSEEATKMFRQTLDEHGHGFHYAVLRHIGELEASGSIQWQVDVPEFPVEYGGGSTHIDLVLRYRKDIAHRIVAECKRANPAMVDWCFVRTPQFLRLERRVVLEWLVIRQLDSVTVTPEGRRIPGSRAEAALDDSSTWPADRIYNLALPVRIAETKKKGDRAGASPRTAVDDAVSKVLRGANGLMQFLAEHREFLFQYQRCAVIPVVFTTANLHVSDVSLEDSDLRTGRVPDLESRRVSWLWLKLNVSATLKHSLPLADVHPPDNPFTLRSYLEEHHSRCVAIVNAEGIEEFLKTLSDPGSVPRGWRG